MREFLKKHLAIIIFLSISIIAMYVIGYLLPSHTFSLRFIGEFLNKPLSEIRIFELMIVLVLIDWIIK